MTDSGVGSDATSMVLRLGSRYHLTSRIGGGAMGEVWRGHDDQGRERAFKLLRPDLSADAEVVRRFVAERSLLTSIRDAHVVQVLDLVIEGTTLAIVMELVPGGDLRALLRDHGTLAPSDVAALGAQIARGLSAIHSQHVVHRDIKPENILVDLTGADPVARIADFGVARLASEQSADIPTVLAGTPHFMAPEVFEGATPTPGSDLYSLGILLYELTCGVPPFFGRDHLAVMYAHAQLEPGRPEGVPEELWEVVERLLRKSPAQRPATAAQVADRLEWVRGQVQGVPAIARLVQAPEPRVSGVGCPPAGASGPSIAPDETLLAARSTPSRHPVMAQPSPYRAPTPPPPPVPQPSVSSRPVGRRASSGRGVWAAAALVVVVALVVGYLVMDRRGDQGGEPVITQPVTTLPATPHTASSQEPTTASAEPTPSTPSPTSPPFPRGSRHAPTRSG